MAETPETWVNRTEIGSDPATGWTLPAKFYFDPGVADLEIRKIFRREWQVVAHRSQLQKSGDYVTVELLGEPLLLVCGPDGQVRGFYNVCRHRAGPPASGCGSRKVFRCGYHGWTYGLDGKLISAPEVEGVQNFDPAEFSLLPVRVEEWGGLVLVNLDKSSEGLDQALRWLARQLHIPKTAMRMVERRTYEMNCNWKTYVDNYLEGYHLPSVHPGLNRELEYNSYAVEPHENYVRQHSAIRAAQVESKDGRRYRDSGGDSSAEYYWIFPNWMINLYPDNLSLNIVLPMGAERSLAVFEWYLPADRAQSEAATASVDFSHEIQLEDVAICERVQKNLASSSYDRGRYSVKQETGVHAFHRMYLKALQGRSAKSGEKMIAAALPRE
jgi:choline monooxygenase